jgi:glutamyl-tRNA reductase
MLESLSVGADTMAAGMLASHSKLSGAVVVATCNRFEVYLDLAEPFGVSPMPAIRSAIDVVSSATGVAEEALRDTLQLVHGNGVAEHLFAVASGLESVVVGEGEIAGQVRRSLERARRAGTTSPQLERLFQRASQTSRGVKNHTGIGSAGRSIVRLALDLAESRIADWAETRVLLVGTGRYAGASLAALRDRGVTDVLVYSPSGRAPKFAASHGIQAVAEPAFAAETARADIIVTCTVTEGHVITAEVLTAGRALTPDTAATTSPSRRQLIIDLGLPRNVDPDVQRVSDVDLLDLETVRLHAPLEELNATSEARELVGRAARKFTAVTEEHSLAPAVVALRTHVLGIVDAEITRARERGDSTESTEAALRHLAGVLLHTPMVRSRELARAGETEAYLTGLSALFGLEVAPTAHDVAADEAEPSAS